MINALVTGGLVVGGVAIGIKFVKIVKEDWSNLRREIGVELAKKEEN